MARSTTRRAILARAAAAGLTVAGAAGAGRALALEGGAAHASDAPGSSTNVARRASAGPGEARLACSLDALLDRRRMVRRFTDEPVDDAVVRRLIDAGTRAPSAGNLQPWAFVVVRDAERRMALARAALGQTFVAEAPVVIVPCAVPARARERYGERAERYATIDTSFASLLILLAVVEEGLGACF